MAMNLELTKESKRKKGLVDKSTLITCHNRPRRDWRWQLIMLRQETRTPVSGGVQDTCVSLVRREIQLSWSFLCVFLIYFFSYLILLLHFIENLRLLLWSLNQEVFSEHLFCVRPCAAHLSSMTEKFSLAERQVKKDFTIQCGKC